MSTLMNFATNTFRKLCEHGVSDRANFLKNISVIAFALGSMAQTVGIIFNDKIPSKEKKFLIPQEIFDGITNATLLWLIASKSTNLGKKLILKKYFIPKQLVPVLEKFVPKGNNIAALKESFFKHIKDFGKPEHLKIAHNAVEGMGVAVGILGAILSNNIITPIVRNKLAGICQKKDIAMLNTSSQLNPNFGNLNYSKYANNKLPVQNKGDVFNSFYNASGNTMKI